MKMLKISSIREGTVIDHIPSDKVFKVVEILGLKNSDNVITIGSNLESKKLGKKGIIKIGGRFLTNKEVDKISLVAPHATVNIIKDYNVVEKKEIEVPDEFVGVLKCPNPKCITNVENIKTKFYVLDKKKMRLKCHYCERVFEAKDVKVV